MKAAVSILSLVALAVLVLMNAPAAFARSGWGLEDPQLCVNGQLLVVIPAGPADVYVTVPKDADVSYDAATCNGNPLEAVVPPDHVTFQGANKIRVTANVPDGTKVYFDWGSQSASDVAKHGVAKANFSTR